MFISFFANVGMGKRRSMLRKKKYDEARSRITINSGVAPWSDLPHDVLVLVMMKLGVIDFVAFSRVCKSWRSVALSNRNKFIVSRPPMSVSIYSEAKEKGFYYLKDFEGRILRIILPHSAMRRWCVGVTCGYLVLFDEEYDGFWLVNPITRHELYFPGTPCAYFSCPGDTEPFLVFSPLISEWVLVVVIACSTDKIWFCIADKVGWHYVSSPFPPINDLHAFKGKIYTIHYFSTSDEVKLCELKLFPEAELVLLETKNFPKPNFRYPGFVTSGENLYVIDRGSKKHPYNIHEIDLDQMIFVSSEKKAEEYAFFLIEFISGSLPPHHGRYVVSDKNGKGGSFHAKIWYLFFDCLNVDLIH